MSLYAIGDLHLCSDGSKPMDIFGARWHDHAAKLKEAFSELSSEDVTVLCGDSSWAMGLEEATEDFRFIHELPGTKLILKGNHDYWWNTAAKMQHFFDENGFDTLHILHNNCFFYNDVAICGSRGWFLEEDSAGHGAKIMNRELMRIEASLKAAGDCEKYVFLHYPPKVTGYECSEILALLEAYQVRLCCYGHLHGSGIYTAFQGNIGGTEYRLVSADSLMFKPWRVL